MDSTLRGCVSETEFGNVWDLCLIGTNTIGKAECSHAEWRTKATGPSC